MPLTDFQRAIAQALAAGRTPDSFLAGGAALHIEPNTLRYSNDLDYFQDSAERVAGAFEFDQKVLVKLGVTVKVAIERPGFVRAIVTRGEDSTKVEWVHDTAWRFLPALKSEIAGFVLHPLDLAVNKVLALIGRDEPRDLLDTLFVHEKTLCLGALVWAGAGKDPGFTPLMILGMLRRRGRFHPEDFERLALTKKIDLVELKTKWLEALDDAQDLIDALPPDEVGCLYYSARLAAFPRDPRDAKDCVAHYGRPGGVLPLVGSPDD